MTGTREVDLSGLRKVAEEMAKGRGERVTTGHLLAAIASKPGGAADLLKERRLDAEVLLKAARILTDDHTDAVARAMQRARELAARSATREASGLHLLFALCQERTTAAFRAIEQCGSDVTKLRTAAMQIAMGLVSPRRVPAAAQLSLAPPSRPHAPPAAHPPAHAPAPAPAHAAAAPSRAPAPVRPRRHRSPGPA